MKSMWAPTALSLQQWAVLTVMLSSIIFQTSVPRFPSLVVDFWVG